MAETKQITATLEKTVYGEVYNLSAVENRSFSGMVETLLKEALTERAINNIEKSIKKKKK